METRTRLAEIYLAERNEALYLDQLGMIVAADRDAGAGRTDRSRYLASRAALVLAERKFDAFAAIRLVQPFEASLQDKQAHMDTALAAFEELVGYQVAEVTAAATFHIAETYLEFSRALMQSERPAGLSDAEKVDYELVIEEEAFPFEEQAIDVHEKNFELLAGGIYNPWVQKSLDQLATLMPGRYAKSEISGGFMGSIDTYAYRMPIAPPVGIEPDDGVETPDDGGQQQAAGVTARLTSDGDGGTDQR